MTTRAEALEIATLRAHWFSALASVVAISKIKDANGNIAPAFLAMVDQHVSDALTRPLPIPAFEDAQPDLFAQPIPKMTAKDVGVVR